MMECEKCNGLGWVCESHPDKEWENCITGCGGAGMSCTCNPNGNLPKGSMVIASINPDEITKIH